MNDYDVVIVGGRVAGASTALLLARAGLRVAVVERSRRGSDTVSTHALMRAGVLQLSRWGLLPELVAAGTPAIRQTAFHYGDGGDAHVTLRATRGVDALYAPRRRLLDRVLVEAAAAAGAEVLHETSVVGLDRDDGGRVLGVRLRVADRREVAIGAALTVGADGLSSLVAHLAGAPLRSRGRAASAILYRYLDRVPSSGYVWGYGTGAAAGLIPTDEGRTCVFVSTTPARMRALRRGGAEAAFHGLLDAVPTALSDAVRSGGPPGRLHGWHGAPGQLRRSYGPGWALVGDAGYNKDPITTHGITDALRDAELLSDAVLEGLGGGSPVVALARYEATRDRLSRALYDVTESVARYDWDADRIRALLRRVSSAMSDELDLLDARPALRPERV
jgi:flavin-dependent dehydrogenase